MSSRVRYVGPDELLPVAEAIVKCPEGVSPRALPGDVATELVVELCDDQLDTLPSTAGMRADGGHPDGEAHGISVHPGGIRVWSRSAEGAFRGLMTVQQLIVATEGRIPCGTVLDTPRYAWRGLSLDVVRWFPDLATVLRVVDICAHLGMNVLHLHVTDDEGWRLPSPELRRNAPVGAAVEAHYTGEELAELDRYAAAHFVTVVPEIDMPGHSAAAVRLDPRLGPRDGSLLDTGSPHVARFVDEVIAEAIQHFPRSVAIHLGGDEAFGLSDDDHAAFVSFAAARVVAQGRLPLGWQECVRADLPPEAIVQYWMDESTPVDVDALTELVGEQRALELAPQFRAAHAKAATDVDRARTQGRRLIASPSSRTYLDRPHAGASLDPRQQAERHRLGLHAYPETPLRDYLEWDPVLTHGIESDHALIGIEAALWCETVTSRDDLEMLLLPRLAATAEKAWAPIGHADWADHAERVLAISPLWTERGWQWYRSAELAPPPAREPG